MIFNVFCANPTFSDVAECIRYGLEGLGLRSEISSNIVIGKINIVLGAHEISNKEAIPKKSIIVNLEQIFSSSQVGDQYISFLSSFVVWDYSKKNIAQLANFGIDAKHLRIGYSPLLCRVKECRPKDIDVLFYGAVNNRRKIVLDKLKEYGLNVIILDGKASYSFGSSLDKYISRSKVVLNMHYYPSMIFEVVRVSYLLINRKAVVAEVNQETEIESELLDAVHAVPYEGLVDACLSLVNDEIRRNMLESNALAVMKTRDQSMYLRDILPMNEYTLSISGPPKKINLGSGKNFLNDSLNIDINPYWKPDLVTDLCEPNSLERQYITERFGTFVLSRGWFELIIANEVLEHVHDLVGVMKNCLDLLSEGGILKACVPYDLSYGAWQDPTHVRAFNERSWWYYTHWFWYLGWNESRFNLKSLEYSLNEYGIQLQAKGHSLDEILKFPRSVDSMTVELQKINLTDQEREFVAQYMKR